MTIATYADLKEKVEAWSHRNDVATMIDDFIDVTEPEIWKTLRVREMEARATNTATTRFLSLPTGFLQMRRLTFQSGANNYDIAAVPPESLQVRSTSGLPATFTVTSQLEFDRTPDSSYTVEMQYWKKLDALSNSNTTNDILTYYPNIYLYGCLWALYEWAAEEGRAQYYWGKFQESMLSANRSSKSGRYGPAPRARIEGLTP